MKIRLTIFALFFILIASGQQPQRQIQIIICDLNNDNKYDTILLYSTFDNTSYFNSIVISITGFGRQSFKAKNEWTNIDPTFLSDNKNGVKSEKLFLYKTKNHPVILLFGILDGAGYREDFSIISIINSKALMIFDKGDKDEDIEVPVTLADIDNDNKTEFIFCHYGEMYEQVDSLNADIGTYNPYLVYTIGDNFKLNKPLTKKYNQDHYVFAGYNYNENIKVLYPRDKKKPRILNLQIGQYDK